MRDLYAFSLLLPRAVIIFIYRRHKQWMTVRVVGGTAEDANAVISVLKKKKKSYGPITIITSRYFIRLAALPADDRAADV